VIPDSRRLRPSASSLPLWLSVPCRPSVWPFARPAFTDFHATTAVSVRRLAGLASSFLRTTPREVALAFGSRFHILISRRGLAPHKFAPMLGVHKRLHATADKLPRLSRAVLQSE
jgi:hypothetical protein